MTLGSKVVMVRGRFGSELKRRRGVKESTREEQIKRRGERRKCRQEKKCDT